MPSSVNSLTITAGAALGVATVFWRELELAATVSKYSFMVFLVDRLPSRMRRELLAKEYSGEMLERRLTQTIFKGTSTIRALWRMTSINLHPRVAVGAAAPATPVHSLRDQREINLSELAQGARPLVLNFGSCT